MRTKTTVIVNSQKNGKKCRTGFAGRMKRRFLPGLCGSFTGVMLMGSTVFASGGTSAITQPLDNLKTLVIAVIGAVGVIMPKM